MDKIGSYQILEILHRGPQPLYRAKAADGRIVAVKTIPVAGLSAEMRERFMREAETCRVLHHPNLVQVFEVGEAQGVLYQAMELLEGTDLGKVMGERQFTWDEKLSIMEQVCDALQYAHEHKLVHRDIKPANLFLENSGRVRVLDFGMVRLDESDLTKAGSSLGTLNYMAPEQIRGDRCTTASDVFSAGIVFYQLATGKHPFSAKDRSLVQVVSAIVFETPPKLTDLSPDAPEGLEFILNKALEKDPAKRIQSGGDLKQALALCRITMKLSSPTVATPAMAPPPAAQNPGETKIMRAADPSAPAPAEPVDVEKTKVMRRQLPVSGAPRPSSGIREPAASTTSAVRPPPPPPAPPSQFRYCPSCTAPNPPAATVCRNCGNPLGGAPVLEQPKPPTQWGLYIAIGVAGLLLVALILVLIVKQ